MPEGEKGYFPRGHKYGARATWVDNIRFPSKMEADRYVQLKMLLAAKKIFNLSLHPEFRITVNGVLICKYIADSMYQEAPGKSPIIIEDVKGSMPRDFKMKWKLVNALYGHKYVFRLWPQQADDLIKYGKRASLKKYKEMLKQKKKELEGG